MSWSEYGTAVGLDVKPHATKLKFISGLNSPRVWLSLITRIHHVVI